MFYAFSLFLFGSHVICEWFMQASANALENLEECPVPQKGVPKHQEYFFFFFF